MGQNQTLHRPHRICVYEIIGCFTIDTHEQNKVGSEVSTWIYGFYMAQMKWWGSVAGLYILSSHKGSLQPSQSRGKKREAFYALFPFVMEVERKA